MYAPILALLAALVLTGAAAAGSAESPEISDPAGDAGVPGNELGDITAAWFEEDASGLQLTISVAKLQRPPPGVGWAVVFDLDGATLYMGAYSDLMDTGPVMLLAWGPWDRARNIPLDFTTADGKVTEGTPGTVVVKVAKADLAPGGLAPGSKLTSLAASAGHGMQITTNGMAFPEDPVYREWDGATGVDFALAATAPSAASGPNATGRNLTSTGAPEERSVPLPLLAPVAALLLAARRR